MGRPESLFNLITNAYDAIQKKAELLLSKEMNPHPDDPSPYRGRLVIKARTERKDGQGWIILETRDNGVGMSPREVESLFIPFFTTKATSEKGTGLGLYVIHRIIEKHGGTISATSTYGGGTVFTIRLPVSTTLHA